MKIAIIGSGISGLALASALKQKGIPYQIFEKDEFFDSKAKGYSLTIQQGIETLEKLNVADEVRNSNNRVCSSFLTLDSKGNAILCQPVKRISFESSNKKNNKKNHNFPIPRLALRSILLESLGDKDENHVIWGKEYSHYEENLDKVIIYFKDGTNYEADLLIGCDGIWSKVRNQLIKDEPVYLGVYMINGINICPHNLFQDRVVQIVDGQVRLFTKPFDDEKIMWQVTFPVDYHELEHYLEFQNSNKEMLLKIVIEKLKNWFPLAQELISTTEIENLRGGGLYDRNVIKKENITMKSDESSSWPSKRVILIGDSLHPMSPFKGQGANQALTNSYLFATLLEDHLKLHSTLINQEWIQLMDQYHWKALSQAGPKVLGSRKNVEFFHQQDCLSIEKLYTHTKLERSLWEKEASILQDINSLNLWKKLS